MNPKQRKKKAEQINAQLLEALIMARKVKTPKMPRKDLAAALGVEPSTALRLENGTYKLTISRLIEWADILGVDPVELFTQAVKKGK